MILFRIFLCLYEMSSDAFVGWNWRSSALGLSKSLLAAEWHILAYVVSRIPKLAVSS